MAGVLFKALLVTTTLSLGIISPMVAMAADAITVNQSVLNSALTTPSPLTTGSDGFSVNTGAITAATTASTAVNTDPMQVFNTIPEAQKYWQQCYDTCRANKDCNTSICAYRCRGEVIAHGYRISRISDIMDYDVKAAFAASCLDQFADFYNKVQSAFSKAMDLGLSPITFIVKTIVDAIIDAVIDSILTSLANAVCNVTNEAIGAINSFARNAICLPSLKLGNPLDFNLDLGRMKCNGWSVDLVTGGINGQPVQGVSVPSNALSNSYNTTSGSNPAATVIAPNIQGAASAPIAVTTDPSQLIQNIPNLDPVTLPSTNSGGAQQ